MEKNTQYSLNLNATFPAIKGLLEQEGLLSDLPYLKEKVFEDLPSRYEELTPDAFLMGANENKEYLSFIASIKSKTAQEIEGILADRECDENTLDETRKAFAYLGLSVIWDIIAKELGSEPNDYLKERAAQNPIYYPHQDKTSKPIVGKITTDCATNMDFLADALFSGLEILKEFRTEKKAVKIQQDIKPLNSTIASKVALILSKFDELYAPCFLERPVGVLTSNGLVTFNYATQQLEIVGEHDMLDMSRMYMEELYKKYRACAPILPEVTEKRGTSSDYVDPMTGNLWVTYSPYFHALNVFGVTTNGDGSYTTYSTWKEYRPRLKNELTHKFNTLVEKIQTVHTTEVSGSKQLSAEGKAAMLQGLKSLEFLFTNAIIVDNFDSEKDLKMRDLLNNRKMAIATPSQPGALLDVFNTNTGKVIYSHKTQNQIQTTVFLFNEAAYDNEIYFAYKAYNNYIKAGSKPDLANIILGKNTKGEYITADFQSADTIFTSLLAGSGSGKGVLTLSILAGLVANGVPFAYFDYKPDMSATLWDLERDLISQGQNCRILSVEAQKAQSSRQQRPVRPREFGLGNPDYRIEGVSPSNHLSKNDLSLIPYLKGIQMFTALASLRAEGIESMADRAVMILDEAQAVTAAYNNLASKLEELKKKGEAKGKTPAAPGYNHYSKMYDVLIDDMFQQLNVLITTNGRIGNVGALMIGQNIDPEKWYFQGGWAKGAFGSALKNTTKKIVGRGAGSSKTYGLEKVKNSSPTLEKVKTQRGYFAMHSTGVCPEEESALDIFKSYLVLNTNDFDRAAWARKDIDSMPVTGGLLNNIGNATLREEIINNEFLQEDGSVREEIGFIGLMKKLVGNDMTLLSANLSKGYNVIEEVARKAGIIAQFGDLDTYLFSCAEGSFFTVGEIVAAVVTGVPVDGSGASKTPNAAPEVPPFNELPMDDFMTTTGPVFSAVTPDPIVEPTPISADFTDDYSDTEGFQDSADMTGDAEMGADIDDMSGFDGESSTTPPFAQPSRFSAPVNANPVQSPKERTQVIQGVYNKPLGMTSNPFQHAGEGFFGKQAALAEATKIVLKAIQEAFGGFDRVTSFDITMDGIMIINKIKFVPTLPASIVESMPIDIQHGLHRGSIVDLFDLHYLTKFKNLASLVIEDPSFANSRAKREIGVYNNNWKALFNKFKHLSYLSVGGKEYGPEGSYDAKKDNAKEAREGKLRKAGIFSSLSPGFMSKAWDRANANPLFKATKRTLGGVIAYNGLIGLATLFGPVALVAGAVAGGLYLKNR